MYQNGTYQGYLAGLAREVDCNPSWQPAPADADARKRLEVERPTFRVPKQADFEVPPAEIKPEGGPAIAESSYDHGESGDKAHSCEESRQECRRSSAGGGERVAP